MLSLVLVASVMAGSAPAACPEAWCAHLREAPNAERRLIHGAHPGEHVETSSGEHAATRDGAPHAGCDRARDRAGDRDHAGDHDHAGDGASRAPCCPSLQGGGDPSAAATGRERDVVELVATRPADFGRSLVLPPRTEIPRRLEPGAPPGTLIDHHTSLLL